MGRQSHRVLERGSERLTLGADVWASFLLLASKRGWRPERPTYFFLGDDCLVQDQEAAALAAIVEGVWDEAQGAPLKLERPVALPTLLDIGAFCLKGGFVVR